MRWSDERILTTHTGSLPRPPELTRLYVRRARGETIDPAELDQVGNFRQFRRPVARDEIAVAIVRMPDADMAERIEHALIGHDARRHDQFVQHVGEIFRHLFPPGYPSS